MLRIGKKIENVQYTKRQASYVIIEHEEDNRIAIATDGEWFLLGGGIEGEETEIEALRREVIEESGYSIKNIRYFDKVTAWADGGKVRGPLDVTATIYIAEFDKKVAEPIEKDHKVFWVNAEEYKEKLFHEYQRYILDEYVKKTITKIEPFNDDVIYETENFAVAVPKTPHIPRLDGGHLWIRGKKQYFESRTDLEPKLAIEVMRLTMLLGESMINGMRKRGINIEKINYQENGNWAYKKGMKSEFHIHLYGRTKDSVTQTWGEALAFPNKSTGFYDRFESFSKEDIEEIKKQINLLEKSEKYNIDNWNYSIG